MTPSEVTEDMAMTNGTDPNTLTDEERLAEVSMLLSLAMMRLWAKRRPGARRQAWRERAISRVFGRDSLGLGAESPPLAAAGKP